MEDKKCCPEQHLYIAAVPNGKQPAESRFAHMLWPVAIFITLLFMYCVISFKHIFGDVFISILRQLLFIKRLHVVLFTFNVKIVTSDCFPCLA